MHLFPSYNAIWASKGIKKICCNWLCEVPNLENLLAALCSLTLQSVPPSSPLFVPLFGLCSGVFNYTCFTGKQSKGCAKANSPSHTNQYLQDARFVQVHSDKTQKKKKHLCITFFRSTACAPCYLQHHTQTSDGKPKNEVPTLPRRSQGLVR